MWTDGGRSSERQGERYVGHTLGERFQLQRVLGAGGMGVVFEAQDLASPRRVAIKLTLARGTPDQLARFFREGEISARLHHPGIVAIHSAGEVEGKPYLVYELVPGARDLGQAFATAGLATRLEWTAQVADALGYAHARGVVHRDIKPENVLVDEAGRARLSDFGIAAVQGGERLTATGAWIGTPLYMAPERFSGGACEPTPASDVWSLGVLLYEALTGRAPFAGASIQELAPQIARATPEPPRRLERGISRDLERVCLRALARDPAERYSDGAALAQDLRRALRGEALHGAQTRPKLPLALAGLLALGALAGGALGLNHASRPRAAAPSAPTLPRATGAPSAPQRTDAIPLGLQLQRGQSFRALFESWDSWEERAGPRAGSSIRYRVDLWLRFDVRGLNGQLATLDATLERVFMSLDDMKIDSSSGSVVPVQAVIGKSFVVRVEQTTGRIHQVLGVRHLREEIVAAALPPARPLLTTLLSALNDEVLASRLGAVFHHRAPGPLEDRWELQRELRINNACGIRFQAPEARTGAQEATWVATSAPPAAPASWTGLSLPPGARLVNPELSGSVRFVQGRPKHASLRCSFDYQGVDAQRSLRFELRYRELDPSEPDTSEPDTSEPDTSEPDTSEGR